MKKPLYELIPLKAAITQCRVNINAFQQAIVKENDKIKELQGYIRQWEEYNKGIEGNGNNLRQGE